MMRRLCWLLLGGATVFCIGGVLLGSVVLLYVSGFFVVAMLVLGAVEALARKEGRP